MNDLDPPKTPNTQTAQVHRLKIDHSVYYAVQEPAITHSTPPALIIAAHGYGQSCKNFIRKFQPWCAQNVLVAAPQGPSQLYWEHSPPKIGFSWMTSYMRENTVEDLMAYMTRLFDDLRERYSFDPNRVFILGFSQGSALAFRLGASGIVKPAGVIACGGDLPPDVAQRLPEIEPFPALLVHGKDDPFMSYAKAREGEQILRDHQFPVDTLYFDGGHDMPPETVAHILDWILAQPTSHEKENQA